MGQHPKVVRAMIEAATRFGAGRAARATSPAPIIRWSSLRESLPISTARRLRSSSLRAISRIRRASQTVAKGTERLRITPTPCHDDHMIAELAAALVEVWNELDLPRGNLPYAAE
jgi:hypothetical protein